MIDKALSDKLYKINFVLMILVVFLHSENLSKRIASFTPSFVNYYLQNFIYAGICIVAVPLFFIISGFLFYDTDKMNISDFYPKITKRVKTIFVPFLLVSLYSLCLIIVLQNIPYLKKYFNHSFDLNLPNLLIKWLLQPFAYQLWFLRNLFLLILLSPFIYCLIIYLRLILIIFLCLSWFFFTDVLPFGILTSSFFFILGAYLRIYQMKNINRKSSRISTLFLVGLWLFAIFVYLYNIKLSFSYLINNVSVMIGVVAMWSLFDRVKVISAFNGSLFKKLIPFSFFLYLFHEPILTIIVKLLFSVTHVSDIASVFIFIVAPIMTIFICILFGFLLKKHFSALYSLITGGR